MLHSKSPCEDYVDSAVTGDEAILAARLLLWGPEFGVPEAGVVVMVGERTIDGQVFAAAALFGRACGLIRVLAVSVSRWPRPGWSEALGGRAQRRERDSRSESQRETEGQSPQTPR